MDFGIIYDVINVLNFPRFWEMNLNKWGIIIMFFIILFKIRNIRTRWYMLNFSKMINLYNTFKWKIKWILKHLENYWNYLRQSYKNQEWQTKKGKAT